MTPEQQASTLQLVADLYAQLRAVIETNEAQAAELTELRTQVETKRSRTKKV